MTYPFEIPNPFRAGNLPAKDLWEMLADTKKPIVMYGMGNGADKILRVCEERGIVVQDFFASDGFVRGHSFHGKTVLSYSDTCRKYGMGNFIILLSFASSLPDVLANISRIAEENELYAPDVPVCGDALFDMNFFTAHKEELLAARALLADDLSRKTFDSVILYKLTGDIRILRAAESTPESVMRDILTPERWQVYADLGAYTGDTVRALLPYAENLRKVYAMEPDPRTFRKLEAYAKEEARAEVHALHMGAWSHADILPFDASGNRNAGLHAAKKTVDVRVEAPDNVVGTDLPDFIKYDVEGAEAEALRGSAGIIRAHKPQILLSVYHRSEDLYSLPLQLHELMPDYRFYMRRFPYIPAWDLNLYAV